MKNQGRKINQLNLDGSIIKSWMSIKEAAISLGISASPISRCCRGERLTSGGFRWNYVDQSLQNEEWLDHPVHPIACSSLGRIRHKLGKITKGSKHTETIVV